MDQRERFRGALLGLAAGDALGTSIEFCPPGSFTPVTGVTGGGPFGLKPGQWTDDTSMALCLAESLVLQRGFDPADQLRRYLSWYREGHLSSTGRCFDIGGTTRTAIERFEQTGYPWPGSTDPRTGGNGSLMRLAPVPLFYARRPSEAIARAGDSSRTTHAVEQAVDACRYYAGLIVAAANGVSKEELLSPRYSPVPLLWDREPLTREVDAIAGGSFKVKEPPHIRGTGYVVSSMEAALWAFYHGSSFREGALLAVNLGDDADTTGAVYGQLAGAYYGESAIPEEWRSVLTRRDLIESLADALYAMAQDVDINKGERSTS